jgi:hypothetical protein
MRSLRLALIIAALAGPVTLPQDASAQGFFERLFGIPTRPAPPPMPPASVPVPRGPPVEQGGPSGPSGEAGVPSGPSAPREAPTARPVAAKPVSDDSVVNRELKLNGRGGSLRIERAGPALRLRATLEGAMISKPAETCQVQLGQSESVALTAQGKPEGLTRYAADAPACALTFDILEGAVLVQGPEAACTFEAADCRADPRGMWGPEPASLLAQAGNLEQDRGLADKAVRDNYKVLTQRAGPGAVRPIVAEQAAFSSEREQVCREYAREGAHGFCHARYTEARLASLAAKLGLTAVAGPPSRQQQRRQREEASAPGQETQPFGSNPGPIR